MKWVMVLLCVVLGMMCVTDAYADTVKLKNGSYFDGRVLEEKEDSISIQLRVGVVAFQRDEIEEVIYAPEEENLKLESEWNLGTSTNEEAFAEDKPAVAESTDRAEQEGKVKYEGRWITQEAYDVIQRENEIKQKRLRFQKQMEEQRQKIQAEEEQRALQANGSNLPLAARGQAFGGGAEVVASTEQQGQPGVMQSLTEERPFGAAETTSFSSKVKKFGEA